MKRFYFYQFLESLGADNPEARKANAEMEAKFPGQLNFQLFPSYDRVSELIGKAPDHTNHFIFSDYDEREANGDEKRDFRLNLPFETVFFEATDRPLRSMTQRVVTDEFSLPDGSDMKTRDSVFVTFKVQMMAALVHEGLADTYYTIGIDNWIYDEVVGGTSVADPEVLKKFNDHFRGKIHKTYVYEGVLDKKTFDRPIDLESRPEFRLHHSLHWMCESLRDRSFKVGFQKRSEKIRIGTGANRRQVRASKLYLVVPAQKIQRANEIVGIGRPIDWSYRAEVMGHWRKVQGTGKDRHGKYVVEGYTWVVPHLRGPDDKPILQKKRLVQAKDSDSEEQ